MSDPFTNLVQKTGRSMPEWLDTVSSTGLTKHTDIVAWLKSEHGLTHGFANGIAQTFRDRGASSEPADLVTEQYSGAKQGLRPIYDRLVQVAASFGSDVEVAPKKSGVSLRRSKQFALVEAPSAKRVQLGIQLKGDLPTERLLVGNAMCSHKVSLSSIDEIDDELLGWLREAYNRA
jgi:hypothetical protein